MYIYAGPAFHGVPRVKIPGSFSLGVLEGAKGELESKVYSNDKYVLQNDKVGSGHENNNNNNSIGELLYCTHQ